MTATVHPLRLTGRWPRGFECHHVYLLRTVAELHRSPLTAPMEYVAVLPGNVAHKAHIARMHAEHRVRGDVYRAAPLRAFADRALVRLTSVDAEDGRQAILTVLAELDPSIADLQRLWRNGTPVLFAAAPLRPRPRKPFAAG